MVSQKKTAQTDMGQNCSCINPFTNDKILHPSKFKALAGDWKIEICLERVQKIVGKGENAGYHHLLFPQCIKKASYSRSFKFKNECKRAKSPFLKAWLISFWCICITGQHGEIFQKWNIKISNNTSPFFTYSPKIFSHYLQYYIFLQMFPIK